MTQRELAEAVGIKSSHVAYIENGRRKPSISLINRLSERLGLDAKKVLLLAHPEAKQIVDGKLLASKKARPHGSGLRQTTRCSGVTPSPKANSRF
jgi:transcriptional regulator with XRE-family HTH domain